MAASEVLNSAASGASAGSAAGPWGAAIGGLAGAGIGLLNSNASDKAAQEQKRKEAEAAALAAQRYNETKSNVSPYISTGQGALGRANEQAANFHDPGFDYKQKDFKYDEWTDPEAQTLMNQASQATNASSIASGAVGGGAASALQKERMNLATQAYAPARQAWLDSSKMLNDQAQQKWTRGMDFQTQQIGANQNIANSGLQAAGTLAGFSNPNTQMGMGAISGQGEAGALGTLGSAQAQGGALSSAAQGIGTLANWYANKQKPGALGGSSQPMVTSESYPSGSGGYA